MKIAVGILTHNVMSTLRQGLLESTLSSVENAFPSADRVLMDNNSTDGSTEHVMSLGGFGFRQDNGKPGTGRLGMMPHLLKFDPDIIVFSDDDMLWKSGTENKLLDLWSQAPPDLAIVSGLLEPVWHWNTPRETLTLAHTNVLVRDSCPGAAWTFRAPDWGIIKKHMVKDFGYDHKACVALGKEGYRVAQIDLADHIGWGYSTHGNEADKTGRPLDRERWRV